MVGIVDSCLCIKVMALWSFPMFVYVGKPYTFAMVVVPSNTSIPHWSVILLYGATQFVQYSNIGRLNGSTTHVATYRAWQGWIYLCYREPTASLLALLCMYSYTIEGYESTSRLSRVLFLLSVSDHLLHTKLIHGGTGNNSGHNFTWACRMDQNYKFDGGDCRLTPLNSSYGT